MEINFKIKIILQCIHVLCVLFSELLLTVKGIGKIFVEQENILIFKYIIINFKFTLNILVKNKNCETKLEQWNFNWYWKK